MQSLLRGFHSVGEASKF